MIAKDIVEKMEILATQSIYDSLTTLFELYEIISVREFSFHELMKDVRKIKEFEYNKIALYKRSVYNCWIIYCSNLFKFQ